MISCRRILAGLVSVAAAASAQSTGTVLGVLRDSVTNTPVPGANARLMGAGKTFVAAAGADGRYRIDAVPEGKYKLDGYTTGYVGPSAVQDLDIHFTSGSFNADITLDPLAVLRGRVLDDQGTPIEGSRVVVTSSEMKTSYNAISGKDGSFLVKELSPGSATLFAWPPKREQAAGNADAPRIEMIRTYYPSALDATTAAGIHLIPGDRNNGYDIRLIQQQVQRVRGVVRNSAGETVAGAQVDLQPALPNEPLRIRAWGNDDDDFLRPPNEIFAATTTNAKGEFEFRSVPSGSWRLHSDGRSFLQMARQIKEPAESGELQVDVLRSDMDHADIVLERPFDLIVAFEGTANQTPVPFLLVGMLTPSSGLSIPFMTAKPEQLSNSSVVFHGVSPGEYVVRPPRPPASYISVTVGGQEAIGRKVDLKPGTPVHITFSDAKTSIGGSVDTPNSDARGVSVLLFPPREADLEPVRYLSAGSGGDFKFEGLRPATYSVIAVREPDVASLSDLTLRGLQSKAKSVRLEAGATETLTLAVQAIQ
jgi:Carboxypeptidase regulatory-like domain